MERYPNISDHGLIGDLQTAALVATDGTVDFLCCPRFDSPSVFASLLDAEKGGYFRISPVAASYVSKQLYLPNTAMLITRFMTADGVGEVLDFMPVVEGEPTDRHRLVRYLRVPRGTMQFQVEVQPGFDYGRAPHTVEITDEGAIFQSADMALTLHAARKISPVEGNPAVDRTSGGLRATVTLREGDRGRGLILESNGGQPRVCPPAELQRLADDTAAFWKGWLAGSTYAGRWRETVTRSAMTLKLLTYEPTGAPVAAATFGLPEQVGGARNWDYRFTWIRDASLSMHALVNLGYTDEAGKFGVWLRDRVIECVAASNSNPIKVMYRVDGSSELAEETLDHFEGWCGAQPVRIGNGAADQLQLDIYGEAMDAVIPAATPACRSATLAGSRSARSSTGLARTGISQTKGSGRRAVAARTSLTAGSSAGSRSTGQSSSPSATDDPRTWPGGAPSATGSTTRSWPTAGTRRFRHSLSTTPPTWWTPRCC